MASPSSTAVGNSRDECGENPYRVMVVDDSIVIRGWIRRILEGQSGFKIVSAVPNGKVAVEALRRTPTDVIVLDIEMPEMDGLTAIPLLKEIDAGVQIVMASTLTMKNAEISMKALALGATDYIPKPLSISESGVNGVEDFARELVEKVRTLGALARRRGVRPPVHTTPTAPLPPVVVVKKPLSFRAMPRFKPDIIAIGSSTGGPQALFEVIKSLGSQLSQPIVITQHMPPAFTTILAEHISRQCNVICTEAKEADVLKPGHYYVAPGDNHMTLVKKGSDVVVKLNKDAQENFCRPSVDPMMRSLVEIYKNKILGIILTGMGQDGLKGSQNIVDAGGGIIAQDEATSVVWGMPAAVANAGICSAVLPLVEIGLLANRLATGMSL